MYRNLCISYIDEFKFKMIIKNFYEFNNFLKIISFAFIKNEFCSII